MNIDKENVFKLVSELQYKTSDELKKIYSSLFNCDAEKYNNKSALIEKLAYKIQEIAYGDLSLETKRKLTNALYSKEDENKPKYIPGTIITKKYKGKNYEITVCKDHYVFENLQYKSLSAIAKKITGTNWNGRAFFNVK